MPAESEEQRRFMGAVLSYMRGTLSNPSPEVIKAAESMTEEQVKDFLRSDVSSLRSEEEFRKTFYKPKDDNQK